MFSERIKFLRKSLKMSQEEFGDFLSGGDSNLGTNQIVSNLENNRRKLNFEELRTLSERGIDVNWLLTGNNNQLFEFDSIIANNRFYLNIYNGYEFVEKLSLPNNYIQYLNFMNSKNIYAIKIPTEMMSPTIKINDIVYCSEKNAVSNNGIYIRIHFKQELFFIGRFFKNLDDNYDIVFDNKHFPGRSVSLSHLNKNNSDLLTLKVFAINNIIDNL